MCSPSSHYMWCDTLVCCFVYTSLRLAFVPFGFTSFSTCLCEGGEGGRGDSGLVGVVMTRQRFMLVHASGSGGTQSDSTTPFCFISRMVMFRRLTRQFCLKFFHLPLQRRAALHLTQRFFVNVSSAPVDFFCLPLSIPCPVDAVPPGGHEMSSSARAGATALFSTRRRVTTVVGDSKQESTFCSSRTKITRVGSLQHRRQVDIYFVVFCFLFHLRYLYDV